MRVRKKKHGAERIEACSELLIKDITSLCDGLGGVFPRDLEVHLEIGCGKGDFAVGMAKKHPNINFIAMEKVADVCCIALEKAIETKGDRAEDNLRFIIGDARTLELSFPKNSLDCIYLNFSDPWPKSGHAKRRLTHRDFLAIYAELLRDGGLLKLKTDNVGLFDFSLEEFEAYGGEIVWQTRNLHESEKNADNIMTEYERSFSAKGFDICSAWVRLPKKEKSSMIREMVLGNRSQRSFVPNKKIPHDTLVGLCDIARSCPAAMNMQPLKYRIVENDREVEAMLGITRWASSLEKKLPPKGHGPAAFIVICHDTSVCERKPIFMIDVGIVSEAIMLSAYEAGFGGCIIGSASEEAITATLGLPSHLAPVLVLGLGVPEETVVLTEAQDGNTKYYRDENDVHYVPKRPLSEIIIK